MLNSVLRKVAVSATAVLLLLSAFALPAMAGKPTSHGRGHGQEHAAAAKAKHGKAAKADKVKKPKKANKGQAKAAAAKARKAARFQANGTLLGLSGETITVYVKGGSSKTLRGSIADFDAAGARVNRDDEPATLADLAPGDHVAVKGMRVDGTWVAKRVNAESPAPVVEEPTESVTEDPTETVTEDPTATVTEDPTETVTQDPTEIVTGTP